MVTTIPRTGETLIGESELELMDDSRTRMLIRSLKAAGVPGKALNFV